MVEGNHCGPVSYKVQVRDRVWGRHVDQLLTAESGTRQSSSSDDYLYPSGTAEQTRQNEEQHPPEEDSDPQDAQDEPTVTEPPRSNSETAAGTARYPQRSHHPPDYFHDTH